jgi:hypothetical protein
MTQDKNLEYFMGPGFPRGPISQHLECLDPFAIATARELIAIEAANPFVAVPVPDPLRANGHDCIDADIHNSPQKDPYFTGDLAVYVVEDGEPVLYMADAHNHIVFSRLDGREYGRSGTKINTEDLTIDRRSIDEIASDHTTLRITLQDLELKDDRGFYYFGCALGDYATFNPTQRALAQKVYGEAADFEENLAKLAAAGRKSLRVEVESPELVRSILPDGNSGCARLCYLWLHSDNLRFMATVDKDYGRASMHGKFKATRK